VDHTVKYLRLQARDDARNIGRVENAIEQPTLVGNVLREWIVARSYRTIARVRSALGCVLATAMRDAPGHGHGMIQVWAREKQS
jgi:hypothetical protein